MPGWAGWAALGVMGWLVGGTAVAFLVARTLAAGTGGNASAVPANPDTFAFPMSTFGEERTRVLVVDDDAPLRSLLRATLSSEDIDVREAGTAEQALDVIRFWRPRVILLDINMPGLDGLTFCSQLMRTGSHNDAAVILLTGEQISDTTARLAGAKGVVRKPFSPLELMSVVARVVEGGDLGSRTGTAEDGQLLLYARDLASIARSERLQRQLLQEAYRQTATALADAVDVRDRGTGLHAQRVQRYALGLAEAVDPALLDDPSLEYGFLLHDVGKIGISDQVLLKPGALTAEERELIHAHPALGAQILHDVAMLQGAGLDVVRHHHERWDGAGYPDGLLGEKIPLSARVFAVADTLDAMTSDRPYRAALEWTDAVEEILAQSGRQFDPHVVQAFAAQESSLRGVYEELSLVA
jgi:response regulator RpfG family c-di-GMP phosphodiesterase